jgi:hypothetical protein
MTVPQGERGRGRYATGVGDLLLGDGEKERRKKDRPATRTCIFSGLVFTRPDFSRQLWPSAQPHDQLELEFLAAQLNSMDPRHGRGGVVPGSLQQPQMEEIQYFRLPSGTLNFRFCLSF